MRKLFTDFPIEGEFYLSPDDSRHVVRVLRHVTGDVLTVSDGTGTAYTCLIADTAGERVLMRPLHKIDPEDETERYELILAAALLKNDRFDWLVQKATELGVDRIVPIQMKHCVVKLDEKRRKERCIRWQKIALEAAKQCGRTRVPSVDEVRTLKELIQEYDRYFFFIPYEGEEKAARIAVERAAGEDTVICIGPEGGYAPEEIEEFTSSCEQYAVVSLGKRIMRAETAALAACSVIMYERGFV